MKRKIIQTADGSTTIHLPEWNEQYHSIHGAINEARHVFIKSGLHRAREESGGEINILEIGFGTGLNALVTWQDNLQKEMVIKYTGVEAYPVAAEEIVQLNYPAQLEEEKAPGFFKEIHQASWEVPVVITPNFILTKQQKFFKDIEDTEAYDLIYFDAFGARVQPALWTAEIFLIMFAALKPNGILVTYSAKGSVRRAMQEVGFTVERLPGPPGKREMLRAIKSPV